MEKNVVKPEKITKPIQLLGAWLVGLVSLNSCFLFAAANFGTGTWESEALVIASISNVPVFLIAVFLLQTKFRPELQEDAYYANYLSQKTNEIVKRPKSEVIYSELMGRVENIEASLAQTNNVDADVNELSSLLIGVNRHFGDIESIKSHLASKGVESVTVFGPSDTAPTHRVLSISNRLNSEKIIAAKKLSAELKMDGYAFFDPVSEETDEDILIGAYGNIEFETLTTTA
ncbi:hypothetical protein [Marinobacter sp. F4206]|uniref:hypothetical protein n=1 Tax=Marinobacter sp. F4206 TaxID=2861777 RepID=UPI001C5D0701|nr:hypothetical protein [Marinobacter sp. F4206]MBW4936657.1 hypothetical protein [Marinobacter sp. F4206]